MGQYNLCILACLFPSLHYLHVLHGNKISYILDKGYIVDIVLHQRPAKVHMVKSCNGAFYAVCSDYYKYFYSLYRCFDGVIRL